MNFRNKESKQALKLLKIVKIVKNTITCVLPLSMHSIV